MVVNESLDLADRRHNSRGLPTGQMAHPALIALEGSDAVLTITV